MGMFDTIHFEKPIACAVCQAEIPSIQTKAFDCALDDFRIGDCIGHAEEIRIVRESLYCTACLTASVCGHWRRTWVSRRLPSRASLMAQARLVRKWRFVWPRRSAGRRRAGLPCSTTTIYGRPARSRISRMSGISSLPPNGAAFPPPH